MKPSKNFAILLIFMHFLVASSVFAGWLDQFGKVTLIATALLSSTPADGIIRHTPPCCHSYHEITIRDQMLDRAASYFQEACDQGADCQTEILKVIEAVNITKSEKDKVISAVAEAIAGGNCSASVAVCQQDIFSSAGSENGPSAIFVLGALALAAYHIEYPDDPAPQQNPITDCSPLPLSATDRDGPSEGFAATPIF